MHSDLIAVMGSLGPVAGLFVAPGSSTKSDQVALDWSCSYLLLLYHLGMTAVREYVNQISANSEYRYFIHSYEN